jgi:hypothetical protein
MLPTSAQCRTTAEAKLEEAGRDARHRRRFIAAAEGWLFLGSQLRRLEKTLGRDRSKRHPDERARSSCAPPDNTG